MVQQDVPGGFIIRKQTFIVKNDQSIDDVYIREKKVSDSSKSLCLIHC